MPLNSFGIILLGTQMIVATNLLNFNITAFVKKVILNLTNMNLNLGNTETCQQLHIYIIYYTCSKASPCNSAKQFYCYFNISIFFMSCLFTFYLYVSTILLAEYIT